MRRHITGREATYTIASDKRGPVKIELPEGSAASAPPTITGSAAPASTISVVAMQETK